MFICLGCMRGHELIASLLCFSGVQPLMSMQEEAALRELEVANAPPVPQVHAAVRLT